ncbi:unnamed protein product, partial [Ectocarpus sp. 12 AP-2014]
RVVFNFPHTGTQSTHLKREVRHPFVLLLFVLALLLCFLATVMLSHNSQLVSLLPSRETIRFCVHRAMARESELIMVRCLAFDPSVFPGYRHSTT